MKANPLYVVIGLGITGLSCAKFLAHHGFNFAVNDTRENHPNFSIFQKRFSHIPLVVGKLDLDLISRADYVVVSPGLNKKDLDHIRSHTKALLIGDIELFVQSAKAPIIAITGTNAKSTVTTLMGEMIQASQKKVLVGGNIGQPVLDFLREDVPDFYVLELSSFQLETTYSLQAEVATILNITPDHLDRYNSYEEYMAAKHKIYQNSHAIVCNLDDKSTWPKQFAKNLIYFTSHQPKVDQFGIAKDGNDLYLAHGDQILLNTKELPIQGNHYRANALAALALGHSIKLPLDKMLAVLKSFKGLEHRCQLVRNLNGVTWYNDSKGTNVGASVAAIEGIGKVIKGKIVLIAGGLGKNADFTALISPIKTYCSHVVLLGEAAPALEELLNRVVSVKVVRNMEEAVHAAHDLAQANDSVLLSPACASWDMFKDYTERGKIFMDLVLELK